MTNSAIYTHKRDGSIVQITHWDYLYVDRNSGRAYNRWCRFQVMQGERKGSYFEAAIAYFLTCYTPTEA